MLLGIPAVFGYLNWQNSEVTAFVWNDSEKPQLIRVIDDWTGRPIVTGRIEPGTVVVAFQGRPDEWWVNPDRAGDRRRHDVVIQVLGDGCELIDSGRAGNRNGAIGPEVTVVSRGGSVASTDWPEWVGRGSVPILAPAPDPCGASAPVARGLIVNATRAVVSVGHGLVIPPCSSRIVHPGDLPDGSLPEPADPADAIRVVIPSIDAQDERWPIGPRSVVIEADAISDDRGAPWVDLEGSCTGRPTPGARPTT